MKDRNKYLYAVVLVLLTVFCGSFYYRKNHQPTYVFINETNDHRFDESIRISILAAFKRTGVQHAVVISDIESQDENFEQSAAKLFKDLELGRQNQGRAVLYYFSPKNKKLKIEVGYALEGELPDATVHGLELAAKSFIFSDRYQDFWAELINTLNIEIADKGSAKTNFDFTHFTFLSGGAGKISKSYDATWTQLQAEFKSANSNEAVKFKAQESVSESLKIYLESLHQGFGDSNLDILTAESKFYRNQTPSTSFQLYRNWRMYEKAGIDQIIMSGSLGFVFFKNDNPVLPIVLRKEENSWRVHEPLSWSLFQRFEDSNQVFLKFNLQVLPDALGTYIAKRFRRTLYTLDNPLSISFLSEAPNLHNFQSPLIHLYWLDKIDKDLAQKDLETLSSDQLIFAADAYTNLGKFSKFVDVYNIIANRFPKDQVIQTNLKFYNKIIAFDKSDWRLNR